jgi:hypothetical protein
VAADWPCSLKYGTLSSDGGVPELDSPGGQMPFVHVKLVDPGNRRYTVDIDSDLNAEVVKGQLVDELKLSPDKKYSLYLVDSFGLSDGDVLMLVEASDQGFMNLVQEQ